MPSGVRRGSFKCAPEDEETARLTLLRYGQVEPGSVRYQDGALHFLLDLSSMQDGDGPAVELVILRELERAVSLHKVPSGAPPGMAL